MIAPIRMRPTAPRTTARTMTKVRCEEELSPEGVAEEEDIGSVDSCRTESEATARDVGGLE